MCLRVISSLFGGIASAISAFSLSMSSGLRTRWKLASPPSAHHTKIVTARSSLHLWPRTYNIQLIRQAVVSLPAISTCKS